MFMSNRRALYLVLVDVSHSAAMIKENLSFWLRYVLEHGVGSSGGTEKGGIVLQVVGSHGDKLRSVLALKECESLLSECLHSVVLDVYGKESTHLELREPIVVSGKYGKEADMAELKGGMAALYSEIKTTAAELARSN